MNRLSPKKETTEDTYVVPEPQRRIPDPTNYRKVIGPAKADEVIFKTPKTGLPYFDPIVRKPNPESEYDERKWPPSYQPKKKQFNRKLSRDVYLLNDNEMADLCYIIKVPVPDEYEHHCYLASEVERRAWEVYGGPDGFVYAKKLHDVKIAERKSQTAGTSSPRTPKKASDQKVARASNPPSVAAPSTPGSVTRTPRTPARTQADPYQTPTRSNGPKSAGKTLLDGVDLLTLKEEEDDDHNWSPQNSSPSTSRRKLALVFPTKTKVKKT